MFLAPFFTAPFLKAIAHRVVVTHRRGDIEAFLPVDEFLEKITHKMLLFITNQFQQW